MIDELLCTLILLRKSHVRTERTDDSLPLEVVRMSHLKVLVHFEVSLHRRILILWLADHLKRHPWIFEKVLLLEIDRLSLLILSVLQLYFAFV